VVILAVDKESRVLLERQYRHSAKKFLYELPAGSLDEGENPLAAGKRELTEETGYSAKKWKRILYFWPSPGFLAEAMSIFLATDLRPGIAQPEDDEVIEIQFVPLKKAVAMVVSGAIQDGKTIARRQKVTLGEVKGNRIAVRAGLVAGQRIVVSGGSLLTDGQAVVEIP